MSDQYDTNKVTDQLGEIFKITENSFKILASCRHTHAAVDLVLDIVNDHTLEAKGMEKIVVRTYETALAITDNPNPDTIYASKFSIQFCAALAFLRGKASLSDFDEKSLWDEKIREVMQRIHVSVDPAIEANYPEKWGASVEIRLR
jgi:2-methylcitrate dehydratase PrpD